jgi:hypothetical protein
MMPADLRVTDMSDLKDLEPLSKRLNAASNELTRTIQVIQDRLNALGIGLEVWLDELSLSESEFGGVDDEDGEPTGATEYSAEELGYGRLGDGWALLVRTRRFIGYLEHGQFRAQESYVISSRPLLKASREVRVAAVDQIPGLIDKLQKEAESVIARVEEAKKIAESLK